MSVVDQLKNLFAKKKAPDSEQPSNLSLATPDETVGGPALTEPMGDSTQADVVVEIRSASAEAPTPMRHTATA